MIFILIAESSNGHSKRYAPELPVAFQAAMQTSTARLALHQDVVFDTVKSNIGNAYMPASGTFVAPVAGIYVFHLSVFSDQTIHCGIAVNGHAQTNAFAQHHSQGGTSLLVHLVKDDVASVTTVALANGVVYGDFFSSFSGFLLFQD